VLEQYCLADGGLVVDTLAAVAISAGADLVEEGAVDFVHLCAVDLGEPLCHRFDYQL